MLYMIYYTIKIFRINKTQINLSRSNLDIIKQAEFEVKISHNISQDRTARASFVAKIYAGSN